MKTKSRSEHGHVMGNAAFLFIDQVWQQGAGGRQSGYLVLAREKLLSMGGHVEQDTPFTHV
jgi:hypothetical protein